jgi:GxxExxY protein
MIHRDVEVHLFECDLIVSDLIILELKVLPFTNFAPAHYAQLIHYLKCWNKDLGLLVNFGSTRAQIERVMWNEPELDIHQDYDLIKSRMNEKDRLYLRQVCQHILAISRQYGLEYPETVYRSLVAIEIRHHGLDCQTEFAIPVKLDNKVLAQHKSNHLLVENNYLLNIRSLLDGPSRYDFAQTKTYLNSLGLKLGLIINFGKKQLQIYGVNSD